MRLFTVLLPLIALIPMTAIADATEAPRTMILPMRTVSALRQYLGTRPYDEVVALINALDGCARAQFPVGGVIRSTGECPEVTEALDERAKPPEGAANAQPGATPGKP